MVLAGDGLIQTCSIEQVVAPIATHLCYLKLLSENEEWSEQFTQLETAAYAVAKTSKNMALIASRAIVESDDGVMKMEMSPLLESLKLSSQHVILAAQKLSIQPDNPEHREELIEATQNVLLGVVKVLLVEDDATLRKITAAAHWLLESLTQVGAATNIRSLLKMFQVYSKAMQLLHNLVMERIPDLRDCRQQEHLKACMETLKRCISMLHTAMYTTIKHPTSEEAQDAKKYILHQVATTVNDIIITLKTNSGHMTTGSCGYYTEKRKELLRLLSNPDFTLLKESKFDILLRDLVFHSMAVANTSRRENHSSVNANCQLVLQLWSEVSQQTKFSLNKQKSKEYEENLLVSLMKQIHKLDDAVVKASLYQVMDSFLITSCPLDHLVNTIHYISENESDSDLKLDTIQPLSEVFIAHADKMAEVASFISALANDEKSLEGVENSRVCLMRLKDEVTPLLLELGGDSVQYQGALHKLINVQLRWLEEKEQLLNAFSNVINVKAYIHLAVQEMKCDMDNCIKAHKEQDSVLVSRCISSFIGRVSQVVKFVRRHVDKSDDPIYRNGLLVLVKQAEYSVAEVTGYTSDIFNTFFDEEEFSSLVDRLTVSIKNTNILCEGLDGLQHPHLLSPLREGARQSAISSPVPAITDLQMSTNDQAISEDLLGGDENLKMKMKFQNKLSEDPEPAKVYQAENTEVLMEPTLILDSKPVQTPQSIDLLPLLCEVVRMTKGKDVEALNTACTEIIELSSCYIQATKEAAGIVDTTCIQEMESLRSELVALTPQLVQTAQETVMNSAKSTDNVFRHSTQFSDLIKNTRKIMLPTLPSW
ncbi:catenin alpha-2 [Hoplias malabaricus]|uniref:catenin alpha-2 n=1 Tax=Hoplias malabaricus TaxID=27720 RepID=UPI0034637B12